MNWDPDFAQRSPLFEPLRAHAAGLGPIWPGLADLQGLLDSSDPPIRNAAGAPLRLAPPARGKVAALEKYEPRLYLKGELCVRERDWHDLLNVLVWLTFPCAKAALNARHYAEIRARKAPNRGPVEDALTLFDEGGVIVVSDDDELLALLKAFRWKDLFWDKRERVRTHMHFHVFGHALYEKALTPFSGITARAILLRTPAEALNLPLDEQLACVDRHVAAHLADPVRLSGTLDLAPVPVLGVPGWCPDNERETYYDDGDHFRNGRTQGPGNSPPSSTPFP